MPRYNVQHPETKKWRCFSTVCDDFITGWMSEERYERWRKLEYGRNCGPVRQANIMDLKEAKERIQERRNTEKMTWEEMTNQD